MLVIGCAYWNTPSGVCTSRCQDLRKDVTVVSEIPLSLPDEQAYLASALQLLIDAAFVRDGTRIGFADVRDSLGDEGLSRGRWAYMLRGDSHRVTSEPVLRSLAEFFRVDSVHLTSAGRSELLEMLADDLPAIIRYRFLKVRRFAAGETLGVDDRALEQVMAYLDSELNQLSTVDSAIADEQHTAVTATEVSVSHVGGGLLAEKNVLISGILTRSSLAFHVARLAQIEGAHVVLSSFGRRMPLTRAAARSLPYPVEVIELDVTDRANLDSLATSLGQHFDVLHGLVHSISGGDPHLMGGRFLDGEWPEIAAALEVGAYSLKSVTVAAKPLMTRGSSVVGVTFDGRYSWPLHDWMGVSKATYESICRYLARYLGPDGIRCNLVSGTPTLSPATQAIPGFREIAPRLEEYARTRAPLGWNVNDPEPLARAVVVLLSDWLPATTGEIIHVDGGAHSTGA